MQYLRQILIKNFFDRKKEIIRLTDICDNMIKQLCQHDFEEDYIDITQYRGENITYYKIGCYTK